MKIDIRVDQIIDAASIEELEQMRDQINRKLGNKTERIDKYVREMFAAHGFGGLIFIIKELRNTSGLSLRDSAQIVRDVKAKMRAEQDAEKGAQT